MKKIIGYTFLIIAALYAQQASAVRAIRTPIIITQPDGSTVTTRLHGDEYFHYQTTEDGYVVLKNNQGFLTYAVKNSAGNLEASSLIAKDAGRRTAADKKFLQTISPYMEFSATQKSASQNSMMLKSSSDRQKAYPITGTPKALVILVNFADKSYVVPDPRQAFTNLLNEAGYSANYGTGSAKDYFKAASFNRFSPQFDVYGPYTLPQNMAYYGTDVGGTGNDQNPRQMIKDACQLAFNDGVNFADYDTDNDGFVDNVFVYYAGNNQAEGAPTYTIWPHRWTIANYVQQAPSYGGKIVWDYACTSELRGTSTAAANMCGIGTFVHEFSHVLGLPDYYCTNGCDHNTLETWSVMDYGPYLNNGRTPPTYSAYDRFFVGWISPIELTTYISGEMASIESSNKAYLIANSAHNMNGANPNPAEFFMIENRQKTGWDSYLPNSGMLIWHINYNAAAWANNSPNNQSQLRVDLVRADGSSNGNLSDLQGDPFPGTSGATSYSPTLWNGTNLNKPITDITNSSGIVSFGATAPPVVISTKTSPSAGGRVTGAGTYTNGSSVTLSATATPDYKFVNWTDQGLVISLAPSFTILAKNDRLLEANFVPIDELELYPVPSTGRITAKFNYTGLATITIYDMAGRQVYQKTESYVDGKTGYSLGLEPLPDGLYFMYIQAKDTNATFKQRLYITH